VKSRCCLDHHKLLLNAVDIRCIALVYSALRLGDMQYSPWDAGVGRLSTELVSDCRRNICEEQHTFTEFSGELRQSYKRFIGR